MSKQQVLCHLQRVICGDETGGSFVERFGNDEIWLSGIGVDATGTAFMLDPFEVYAHFDDGEVQHFPPKTLFMLDVPDAGPFPKTCKVILILAENADGVGHRDVTQKAFTKATEMLQAEKQRLMGSGVAPLDIDWGRVWESIKAILYDYIAGLINSGINDDVFPPQEASVEISSVDFHWGDGTKLSPEMTAVFEAHDGKYYGVYYFEAVSA
jgi:hypothetical protein